MNFSFFELNPLATKFLLIFLHGYTQDGFKFYKMFLEISHEYPEVRMIFPNAPIRTEPFTHRKVSSWFPFAAETPLYIEDTKVLKHMGSDMLEFIGSFGFEPEEIILAGFSQGGALALYISLVAPEKFLGVASIDGFLTYAALRRTKVEQNLLIINAENDQLVTPPIAFLTRNVMVLNGQNVSSMVIPGRHKAYKSLDYFVLNHFIASV